MRLIVGSIVGNEKNNYLEEWLGNVQSYCDLHIIVNDGSTDGTREVISKNRGKTIVIDFEKSRFKNNESELRNDLWQEIRKHASEDDYILIVDADEFYNYSREEILSQCKGDVCVIRLCDMWDETHYRTDGYWSPYFKRLFRFQDKPFCYNTKSGLHLPAVPMYVNETKDVRMTKLYCRHRSYERDSDKEKKYLFYKQNVTDSFNMRHAESIMDSTPELELFGVQELPSVLITSLIHNRDWILPYFLNCLDKDTYAGKKKYCFVVNNNTDRSVEILQDWLKDKDGVIIQYNFNKKIQGEHKWDDELIFHMAKMRNNTLSIAKQTGVDYMINIDSDLLFPDGLIEHLVLSDKKIVSPVFYAGWGSGNKLPQVWERSGYDISQQFVDTLKTNRAMFRVGGLGAFTCIHKSVWEKEVKYDRVFNLPAEMLGEDRDFCIRAVCAGFDLWASTYFDLIHVDNQEMLKEMLYFERLSK